MGWALLDVYMSGKGMSGGRDIEKGITGGLDVQDISSWRTRHLRWVFLEDLTSEMGIPGGLDIKI